MYVATQVMLIVNTGNVDSEHGGVGRIIEWGTKSLG